MGMKTYKDYVLSSPNAYKGDSTYDKQKNRVSYQKYVNNYLAEQQKNEQLSQIEKNKNAALSESAIATERARKYIDAVNKHLGIAGTGYGESKAIDLYAQEAKRRAEINNAHSAQENEALKAYKQAIANAELAENEAMGNIELAEDQEAESKRQGYVETLRQVLEQRNSEEGMSDEDFSRYYKEYSKYLGEDDTILKENLEAVDAGISAKNTQEQVKAQVANNHGVKLGDAITLDELVQKSKKFLDTGEQTELINLITNLAQTQSKNGKSLLDDKAFDINFGYGNEHYYYKDGVFYDISKADARKFEIVNVEKEAKANKLMRELPSKESFADLNYKDQIHLLSDYRKYLSEEQKKQLPDYIKNSFYW